MMEQPKKTILYEEDSAHTPFDYINRDLDLLLVNIFLEAHADGREEISFDSFFKGNYGDIENVRDEVLDTNDYLSVEDKVLAEVIFVFEDTRIGRVIGLGIDDTDEALKDLLVKVAEIGPARAREESVAYLNTVQQLTFLEQQEETKRRALLEEHPERVAEILGAGRGRVFLPGSKHFSAVQPVAIDLPEHVFLALDYDETGILAMKREITTYLEAFAGDQLLEELPAYQKQRHPFLDQIENFYRYLSKIPAIGDTIGVPFSVLSESGFEAVKVMSYLRESGLVKMRWSDAGCWRLKFSKQPTSPGDLLRTDTVAEETISRAPLKPDLSFNHQASTLSVAGHKVRIKGPDQRELLRIVFQDIRKEWFFSEISELYDEAESVNGKKFYNAAYQVNQRVTKEVAIKDFLITTAQTVQINRKYLPES